MFVLNNGYPMVATLFADSISSIMGWSQLLYIDSKLEGGGGALTELLYNRTRPNSVGVQPEL